MFLGFLVLFFFKAANWCRNWTVRLDDCEIEKENDQFGSILTSEPLYEEQTYQKIGLLQIRTSQNPLVKKTEFLRKMWKSNGMVSNWIMCFGYSCYFQKIQKSLLIWEMLKEATCDKARSIRVLYQVWKWDSLPLYILK